MSRFPSLRWAVLVLLVTSFVLLLLTLSVSEVEQLRLRRRSERLLTEIQSIEMRKTPWAEAQTRLQPWGSNTKLDDHCNPHKCSLEITLSDLVYPYISGANAFQRLDDYARWRFKLGYNVGPFVRIETAWLRLYTRIGGHPARIQATVGMRNGTVWSKGFSVLILTDERNNPPFIRDRWDGFYPLFAETRSVSRFDVGGDHLHLNYPIGQPSACEGCGTGWARFTPYADSADVRRLMQIDLSCLTRWHPCMDQRAVMPAAWAQYTAELNHAGEERTQAVCSPAISEMLGRDSARIATGKILDYRDTVEDHGYRDGLATVCVLESIKGATDWTPGQNHKAGVSRGLTQEYADLRRGVEVVLFGRWDRSNEMRLDPGYGCPLVLANESNLTLIRAGIAQDYAATDNAQ
jgi:hypothetical protein